MVINYDRIDGIDALELLLDQYTEWFLGLSKQLFYPDLSGVAGDLPAPQGFAEWRSHAAAQDHVAAAALQDIDNLHKDLTALATRLSAVARETGQRPDFSDYEKITLFFEEFQSKIMRLKADSLYEETGIDPVTGLRNERALLTDLEREMDRLARNGRVFSLALVRIDDLAGLYAQSVTDALNMYLRLVAGFIRKSLRSYDDAYRREDNHFILSLKQTDSLGGIRALKRLRVEVENHNDSHAPEAGSAFRLSLSSCILEPQIGEKPEVVLKNLDEHMMDFVPKKAGACLEYIEVSPLQKFLMTQGQRQPEDNKSG